MSSFQDDMIEDGFNDPEDYLNYLERQDELRDSLPYRITEFTFDDFDRDGIDHFFSQMTNEQRDSNMDYYIKRFGVPYKL